MKNNKAENARKALIMAVNNAVFQHEKNVIKLPINDVLTMADESFKLLESVGS